MKEKGVKSYKIHESHSQMATKIGIGLEIDGAHMRTKFLGYWDFVVAWGFPYVPSRMCGLGIAICTFKNV